MNTLHGSAIADSIAKQKAFWAKANTDLVIGLREKWVFPLNSFSVGLPDGELDPLSFDPLEHCRTYRAFCETNGVVQKDMLLPATPMTAFPWVEGMCGCKVYYGSSSRVVWSEPWLDSYSGLRRLADYRSNPWFLGIAEYLRILVKELAPDYPIATTLMRGPGDVMAAVRGPEKLMYDMYDSPKDVYRLAEACTEVFMESWRVQTDTIPPYHGGYFAGPMALWAPGKTLYYQEDVSAMLSPSLYRRFILPFDIMLAAMTPGLSVIHLHSTALHVLDNVAAIPGLGCVQICVDVLGPRALDLIPEFRKVQESGKALMIYADLTDHEINGIRRALDPAGVIMLVVRGIGQS